MGPFRSQYESLIVGHHWRWFFFFFFFFFFFILIEGCLFKVASLDLSLG